MRRIGNKFNISERRREWQERGEDRPTLAQKLGRGRYEPSPIETGGPYAVENCFQEGYVMTPEEQFA